MITMKNIYRILYLIGFIMLTLTSVAQDNGEVRRVHDKNLENQIKFTYGWEVYPIGHDSLTPHNWYQNLHGPYMRDYANNWFMTYPIRQFSIETDTLTQRQQRNVDTLYQQRLKEFAYREIDLAYLLERSEIIQKQSEFDVYYIKIRDSQAPNCEALANDMKELFDEVIQKFNAINESHLENHKRQEAYIAYQDELDEILWYTKKLYKLTELGKHNIFGL